MQFPTDIPHKIKQKKWQPLGQAHVEYLKLLPLSTMDIYTIPQYLFLNNNNLNRDKKKFHPSTIVGLTH